MKYRKVSPRFWNDEAVVTMDSLEKLIALYVITAQSNRVGLFPFSPALAAEDLDLEIAVLRATLDSVCVKAGWQFDARSRVLWIPRWWRYNAPENKNVLIGGLKDLDALPKTDLIVHFAGNTIDLPPHVHDAFAKRMAERLTQRYPEGLPDVPATLPQTIANPVAVAGAVAGAVTGAGAVTSTGHGDPDGPPEPSPSGSEEDDPDEALDEPDTDVAPPEFPDLEPHAGQPADATTMAWLETGLWDLQRTADRNAAKNVVATMAPLVRDLGDEFVALRVRSYDRWRRDNTSRTNRRKRHDQSIKRWVEKDAERGRAIGSMPSLGDAPADPDGVKDLEREFGR